MFTSFNDARMMSTNALNVVDYQLHAKMLGDSIPAESFAAGANETGGVAGNYNYQSQTPNGWPELRRVRNGDAIADIWKHSDVKNVAYYYVHSLFDKIIRGE